jgi:predicted nucleic acid-binding protein
MPFLSDTNILLRWVQPGHPLNALVRAAIDRLLDRGEDLYITPQNLIEFWNVATRPLERNGFGMTPAEAAVEIARLEQFFLIAPDTPGIYPAWRDLVAAVEVSGVQVHDARLVAVMRVHEITHILTLNVPDFARYPDIVVVHPNDVLGTP